MSVNIPLPPLKLRILMRLQQREQTKAVRYIQLLDQARCNGDWNAVPELVRKIRKHAPERACLALAAESEHAVSQIPHSNGPPSSTVVSSISRFIQPLLEAVQKERTYPEDDFQAQICLSWIYWTLGDYTSAAGKLPESIEREFLQLDGTGRSSGSWTRICALKATYIKGTSLAKNGFQGKALDVFDTALPILATTPQTAQAEPELRLWTELLLTQHCTLSGQSIRSKRTTIAETDPLAAFRAWAMFFEQQPTGGFNVQAEVSRRYVWKEYYTTLSTLLQENLTYPTSTLATNLADSSLRRRQRAELQRVEASYENLILKEISFPRAEQASEEVELWVGLVVQNWKVFCGSSWQEEDLGEGGREAASRNVLDILYRAATKTFHSTSVLRHLFTVHLAVADFDLAFKAFDTYLEIVKKSKARVEKTGEEESGLDDDETILKTVSAAIRALCQYGSYQEAEKARATAHYFRDWITKHYPERSINTNGTGRHFNMNEDKNTVYLPSYVKALTWGAIGIAEAQWARLTYDGGSRSEIQLESIKCLGKSLSKEYGCSKDTDSLFALAMVFAERRELSSALEVVKSALLPASSSTKSGVTKYGGRFARERSLIPLWHLLALLLSARQEFNTAARACEGAFEQFKDPANLFGEKELGSSFRSEHLNDKEEKFRPQSRGVIDEMDDSEKETVLEVKMTQLALIEVLEGSDAAISASEELLGLYSRLFGGGISSKNAAKTQQTQQTGVPRSSAGTLRSLKGSIFGRKSVRTSLGSAAPGHLQTLSERPQTARTVTSTITRAPTIQVTNANGESSEKHHEKLRKRSASLKKKDSTKRDRGTSANRIRSSQVSEASTLDGQATHELPTFDLNETRLSQVGLAVSPDMMQSTSESHKASENRTLSLSSAAGSNLLPQPSQNLPQKETTLKPLGLPGQQDTRLPPGARSTSSPVTRFTKQEQTKRRTTILVRVWLLIAGFYRRAELFDDAAAAVSEAEKLVQDLDDDSSIKPVGNTGVDVAGWGQKQSVQELWGDVFSERGALAVAKSLPYDAQAEFEAALLHFPNHPSAIVGLSNILLDIYCEKLPPIPSIPPLELPKATVNPSSSTVNTNYTASTLTPSTRIPIQSLPLGLPTSDPAPSSLLKDEVRHPSASTLDPPYRAQTTSLLDRLAARDRAYGLLNGLTKLGSGWNYSEAWYALARAYEEGGQLDKAREVLWWCVELEEGRGLRSWEVISTGGYVL